MRKLSSNPARASFQDAGAFPALRNASRRSAFDVFSASRRLACHLFILSASGEALFRFPLKGKGFAKVREKDHVNFCPVSIFAKMFRTKAVTFVAHKVAPTRRGSSRSRIGVEAFTRVPCSPIASTSGNLAQDSQGASVLQSDCKFFNQPGMASETPCSGQGLAESTIRMTLMRPNRSVPSHRVLSGRAFKGQGDGLIGSIAPGRAGDAVPLHQRIYVTDGWVIPKSIGCKPDAHQCLFVRNAAEEIISNPANQCLFSASTKSKFIHSLSSLVSHGMASRSAVTSASSRLSRVMNNVFKFFKSYNFFKPSAEIEVPPR